MNDKMVEIDLKEIHYLYIYMIQKLFEIFDKYNLKYCAIAGTVLGAVRHNGFIPWDDDIDLGMLRDDYERLLHLSYKINKEQSYFKIEHYSNTKYIDHGLIRVLFKGSKKQPSKYFNGKLAQELHIDIFPLDYVPLEEKDKERQKKQLAKLRRQIYYKSKRASSSFLKTIGLYLQKSLILFKSLNKLCMERDYIASKKYQNVNKQYVCSMMSQYNYDRQTFSLEVYGKPHTHEFETIKILIPEHYDEYLQQLYGTNYMTPIKRAVDDENKVAYINSLIYDEVFINN
ncbi:MAG: LicD family protein [Bacilli bacterium]|jgi:lipopolysaccharide cholinephosphotransferase